MNLLTGSIWDKILYFAFPLAISSILQQLFNSADSAIVGRFNGSLALAAVGSNVTVISLMVNLFVGLSVGVNVVIAGYYARGEEKESKRAVNTAILLAFVSGVFLLILGIVTGRVILTWMDTPENVLDLSVLYLRIYFLGMPFMMIYNFGSAVLRSIGDTKRPLFILIFSGICNVGLNLFFVVGLHMSVAGVALATVISNGISSFLILWILFHEEGMIRLDFSCGVDKETFQKVLSIGLPAGIQGIVFSISNVCIQTAVNGFGADATAGCSISWNFEYLIYYLLNAFSQAAITFVSQNYGVGNIKRCRRIVLTAVGLSMIITESVCLLFVIKAPFFTGIFSDNEVVKGYAMTRMGYILTFEFMNVILDGVSGGLRGMGRSLVPALITVGGVCLFRFFWLGVVFSANPTYETLHLVYPVSWIITITAILIYYWIVIKKEKNV
ncbi:MAG: MATE family efflux transporter [Lachnospiraceae bacterium]|nr:MATE family efflux transporter [Lachnospiraceae bacterium]